MCSRIAEMKMVVVGFVDDFGELHVAVINDEEDEIYLEGSIKVDDEAQPLVFEAGAFDLPDWCEEHELDYYEGELETEVIMEKK